MAGKHNGVVKKFLKENPQNYWVFIVQRTIVHWLHLQLLSLFLIYSSNNTLFNIFHLISGSAQMCNKFKKIELFLDQPSLKYAKIHSERWLSLERAVQVIYRTYPALCALEHEGSSITAAKGLAQEGKQYKFIAVTHF